MTVKIEWADHGDNDEHYITCIATYQSKYIISSSKNGTIIFYVLTLIDYFLKEYFDIGEGFSIELG